MDNQVNFYTFTKYVLFGSKNKIIWLIFIVFILSLLPTIGIFVNSQLIEMLINSRNITRRTLEILALVLLVIFFMYILNTLADYLITSITIDAKNRMKIKILEFNSRISYSLIENNAYKDLFQRIFVFPGDEILDNYLQNMISFFIFFVSTFLISFYFKDFLFINLGIIVQALLVTIITILFSKKIYNLDCSQSEVSRISDYIEFDILRGRESAAERNLFYYSQHYNKVFQTYFKKMITEKKYVKLKQMLIIYIPIIIGYVYISYIMYMLSFQVYRNELSLGTYLALLIVIIQFERSVGHRFPNITSELIISFEYIKDLKKFMSLSIKQQKEVEKNKYFTDITDVDSIEFKDVFFKYPNSNKYTLINVSFKILKNEHIAIVGTNGSGKSTIIKLLLGLYDVDKGLILINNVNIKNISSYNLHNLFSVVFQDFIKYDLTFKQNILLNNPYDNERFESVLDKMGLKKVAQSLINGYDTQLGKLKEGVDLSGGEWQRVALARGAFSSKGVRILDEPTASLDPIEESSLYQYFKEMTEMTTIFISHRLGSTRLADKILVLDKGKIVGYGDHDELLNSSVLYKSMFNKQKYWYTKDT